MAGSLAALAPPALAQAGEGTRSLTDWLIRMHDATRQRAFTGTLVVSSGASLAAAKIWHACDGVQQMERVDTLTGVPRTTVRRNSEVITFVPDAKIARLERRDSIGVLPDLLRTRDSHIPAFYTLREQGAERVAGHAADVLDIQPRDGLRFGYRAWAEKKTGLLLKLQTVDERGGVLEQVAFTELQLDAPVSMERLKALMDNTQGYQVERPQLQKTTPQAQGWRLREPVPGFQTLDCHTTAGTAAVRPLHWMLSDGMATVSLFLEPYDPRRHVAGTPMVSGATHSVSRRVGDHWLTAMGEVPLATLERFATALERTR